MCLFQDLIGGRSVMESASGKYYCIIRLFTRRALPFMDAFNLMAQKIRHSCVSSVVETGKECVGGTLLIGYLLQNVH